MRWCWVNYIDDCITWILILLKNAQSLSILAQQSQNSVLIGIMWNVINLNKLFMLTDPINTTFQISDI